MNNEPWLTKVTPEEVQNQIEAMVFNQTGRSEFQIVPWLPSWFPQGIVCIGSALYRTGGVK